MTNNTQPIVKKSNKKRVSRREYQTPAWPNSRLKKGDWLILPLSILAAVSFYTAVLSLPVSYSFVQSPLSSFMVPALPAFLVAFFSLFYIYYTLRRKARPLLAKIIAYTLSFVFLLVLLWIAAGSGQPCTGFFGGPTDCSSLYYLKILIALFNPYSCIVLSLLSLSGIITLLVTVRRPSH